MKIIKPGPDKCRSEFWCCAISRAGSEQVKHQIKQRNSCCRFPNSLMPSIVSKNHTTTNEAKKTAGQLYEIHMSKCLRKHGPHLICYSAAPSLASIAQVHSQSRVLCTLNTKWEITSGLKIKVGLLIVGRNLP